MKIFTLLFTILISITSIAQTFTVNPGSGIFDGSTTTENIVVSGVGTIDCSYGLDQVCIDITHTYISDIDVFILDPAGNSYVLTTGNGGSGQDYSVTCFDISPNPFIENGSAPFNGTYIPQGLNDFNNANNGQNADGLWQLQVTDNFAGDEGTINSISLIFAANAECEIIPAVKEDCNGGTTVCSDVSFSGNSSGAGYKNDLNSTNQGCLLSGENQSSWYYFEAATAGSFEMLIRTTVDYDFAIWGPFSGNLSCPPTSAPLRCSYAGTNGDTGLQAGAGDNSEDSAGDRVVDPIIAAAGDKFIMVIDNFTADGTNFILDWTLTGGATLNCTPLPVSFSDFSITKFEESNVIAWKTYSESNNSHFLIQKMDKDESFYTIKTILGQGNSSTITPYFYEDFRPEPIINYYRIVQVDYDGTETIFSPKSIDNRVNAKTIVKRYNLLGQEVLESFEGLVIVLYEDGTTKKIYQKLP